MSFRTISLASAIACASCASQPERPFRLELELGPAWQSRNDVAVPGDTGTRFPLDELTGSGPFPVGRLTFDWDVHADHGLRVVAAPLLFSGTGTLDSPVDFQGQTYAAGVPTEATYRFNSYRLTYRYRLVAHDPWRLRIGLTGLVRDAKIELEQGETLASETNVGFVPLLHLDGAVALSEHWRLAADFDGAAGGPGRLIDFGTRIEYVVDEQWTVGLGYRTIEGGVDNDTVYNFAWFQSVVASVGFRF